MSCYGDSTEQSTVPKGGLTNLGTNSVTSSGESFIIIYILLDSPAFRWPCHLLLAALGWTCGWPKLTCRELFCHSCWFRARLFLSPLADSCCVVYQLCGTISFPSLQRLQQLWLPHLHLLPPSFHPSESVHRAAGCVVWGIHFVHANCIPSYNFCTNFCWNANNITSQFSLILPTVIIPCRDNCTNCPF